ncbi:hypothetical protein [Halorussus lipolyticus]|uniref:hypothetical protein n=1 Tax=Halorussus lipolyticus TaxID=3034024 RepID=UPI0023E7F81D|nr:hypothetical protein [Halorussus sp. DT80]
MSVASALERPVTALVRVVGLALLSGGVATGLGMLYRSYTREPMPEGLGVLIGLGAVGGWLNTTTALRQFLGGRAVPATEVVLVNVTAFVLGAAAGAVGARSGAVLVTDLLVGSREAGLDRNLNLLVRSVGRYVAVELPDDIESIDGYEPLDDETKATLSGKTLRFPRGLTVAELRDRLAERLRDDYGVGRVDAELADDGTVEYLAAGGRAVGIGPTLAPGTVAMAVWADPAFSASAGDLVQVWRDGPDTARVATAELRATVGDVATLALDAEDAAELDPDAEYRLVTLPTELRPDREFSARLRSADETVGAVTLAGDSPLVGTPVGGLDATVVAVRTTEGVETIPPDNRALGAEDTVYVVARPDRLRKIEAAASGRGSEEVGGERSDSGADSGELRNS